MRTMLRHYEMDNETRIKSPVEQTIRTVRSPVDAKSPIRVTIPQPKSTSPTKSPVKARSPTRLIRSPIIDQEVNQMNSRVFEMNNVLDRVGKDLRKLRGVEGDPVSIEQEVEGLSKFYKDLNEQLQLSQIQNAKLAETIKNKELLLRSVENSIVVEKQKLEDKHKVHMERLSRAALSTTDLLELERKLNGVVVELLQKQIQEHKIKLASLPKKEYISREIEDVSLQIESANEQCESSYRKMIKSIHEQQEHAREANRCNIKLIDLESAIDELVTEKKLVEEELEVNRQKEKYLLIIQEQLKKGIVTIVTELEVVARQIIESKSPQSFNSLYKDFDKLMSSLSFQIQIPSVVINNDLRSRIIRLERVHSELHRRHPRKDVKLDRYYNFIGSSYQDTNALLDHINKLLGEVQQRNNKLRQQATTCIDQTQKLAQEQTLEISREKLINVALAKSQSEYSRIHTTLVNISEKRDELLRILSALL